MRVALVFSILLVTPCIAILSHTDGSIARDRVDTPSGVPATSSIRLRAKVDRFAKTLGRLFDLAGVPLALRFPATHVILAREANRFERLHGHSLGSKVFRDHMHHLLPTWPLFLNSMSQTPNGLPGNVMEGTNIAKDGQGKVVINTMSCVNGKCTQSNKTADNIGAELLDPKVPGGILQRLLASMSNTAKQVMEEMEQAGSDLPDIISGMPDIAPISNGQADNSTGSGMFPFPFPTNITGFNPFQDMKDVFTNITGTNPFKHMNDVFGVPDFGDMMKDPIMPNNSAFNPFKDMKGVFDIPDFGDMMKDPFFPAVNSSANPFDNILHNVLGGMFGDGSTPVQDMPDQGNGDRTSTVTKIENGHAMQETTTCKAGKCTTEKHEFDVPADSTGGQPSPDPSPEIPLI